LDQALKDLVDELAEQRGVDFRGYKQTTLERRIRRRMQQLNVESFSEYGEYIRQNPSETTELLNTVLINVTRFFRDLPAWEVLRDDVLPVLFKTRAPGSTFRVWCAGCATGEEAYSAAILINEVLGTRIEEYEIKIYATDNDESALSIARRAEYAIESLRGVTPEIKAKYFTGERILRVVRDIRRRVIFGRSNLLSDAPISHVDLLLCRNVLIYFDAAAQSHIMSRLKYALNENGILFLGKSESQLKRITDFVAVNAKWRIFQRRSPGNNGEWPNSGKTNMTSDAKDESQEKLGTLKLYYDTILATLEPGIIVLDGNDSVVSHNDKVQKLFELGSRMEGQKLQNTELWQRCPELKQHLEASRASSPGKVVHFDAYPNPTTVLTVTIKPMTSEAGGSQGTLIYLENMTPRVTLQSTVEELETTAEELQSTNEELETTNEELQSTNEELETTNEELQSTNEELETTNEELQSLNEELETTNQELEERTKELDQVNSVYAQTLEKIRMPVLLVNQERHIEFWNTMALRLFGFKSKPPVALTIDQLPLSEALKGLLIRRHRSVLMREQPVVARGQFLGGKFDSTADIHFSVIPREDRTKNVLIMFEPSGADKNVKKTGKNNQG